MAAARSAAAAPYPAPASHPPAGQPKRNILPRVAGLSRGQAPPQKVQKLTPLAWPVPNKKASPHPQESPNPADYTDGHDGDDEMMVDSSDNWSRRSKKKASPHPQESPNPADYTDGHDGDDEMMVDSSDNWSRRSKKKASPHPQESPNPADYTDGHDGDDEMMVDSSDNWSSWTTSCDSFTSMQPYSDNWSSCSWSSTSMQPSIGRYSNANELSTMLSCLSSDATATPSMGSCLSLNRTATPSMKSCLSPPSLSAQSTHSMVTCLTSDGHPTETKMPENGIPDNGWTSPMVAAISSLPIPPQVSCGTQTEEPPSTSARGRRFKAKKWTTRLAGGRAKSSRKVRAALNEWTPMVEKLLLAAISSLPIPPQVPCGTQEEETPPKVRAAPRVDESESGMLKKILVATVQVFLFVGMSIALCIPDADCPSLRGQDL
ncbi:uncharacterized protein LOC111071616 isoform X2 [Drosophila obscura]|uniref:uncharacterized protein LOC111071616 isoform X2 n=1 Tax=Drosophila obscura TaxID=7282 RepID=UPI001BB1C99D|nr:uncharacterized protein LOC111071616 isoform X2 [Drosophila obscura]